MLFFEVLNLHKTYIILTMILTILILIIIILTHFLESMNLKTWITCSKLAWQKRICYTHKKFKARIKSWSSIKPYININTKLRKNSKNDFEKTVFKLMNNSVLEKAMEYVTKNRDIKLVTSEARRN